MSRIGFAPDEIDTGASTRSARLKWVIVIDGHLLPGRAVNAAACLAAATSSSVAGLLGPPGLDATGSVHPGLPWAGCTVLAAGAEQLRTIREKAAADAGMYVADMPVEAQLIRVYDGYLTALQQQPSDAIVYAAVGVVGLRNRVDKLVKRLPLPA